jgi:hypothetical protein
MEPVLSGTADILESMECELGILAEEESYSEVNSATRKHVLISDF